MLGKKKLNRFLPKLKGINPGYKYIKMSVASESVIVCSDCDYEAKNRSLMSIHMKSQKHITNAYNKMIQHNATKQYKTAIADAEQKVAEAEQKVADAQEALKSVESELTNIKAENNIIKNESYTLTLKNSENENIINDLKNEIEVLKNKKNKDAESFNDSASQHSNDSNDFTSAPSNPFPLTKEHRNNIHMFEALFGMRPLKYPIKGSQYANEFYMIRNSFQFSWATWKIYPLHSTSQNLNPRITFAVPTHSAAKMSPLSTVYFLKYHIYMDYNDPKKVVCLCGWDGNKEYVLQKY